jgi:lysophospholipase L1-like esterase
VLRRLVVPLLLSTLLLTVPWNEKLSTAGAAGEIAYLALGDSVASGGPIGEAGSYPRLLGQRMANETGQPIRYDNRARLGEQSSGVVVGQLEGLAEFGPRVVTLTIGANDFLVPAVECVTASLDGSSSTSCTVPDPLATLPALESNLRQILGRLTQETKATVAVTTYYNPFPRGSRCAPGLVDLSMRYLNGTIAKVAGEFPERAVVVDLNSTFHGHEGREPVGWFAASAIDFGCNDIHPNIQGQHAIADAAWAAVSPRLR